MIGQNKSLVFITLVAYRYYDTLRSVSADTGQGKTKHSAEEFDAIWRRHKALSWGRVCQAFHFTFPPRFSAKLQVMYYLLCVYADMVT